MRKETRTPHAGRPDARTKLSSPVSAVTGCSALLHFVSIFSEQRVLRREFEFVSFTENERSPCKSEKKGCAATQKSREGKDTCGAGKSSKPFKTVQHRPKQANIDTVSNRSPLVRKRDENGSKTGRQNRSKKSIAKIAGSEPKTRSFEKVSKSG